MLKINLDKMVVITFNIQIFPENFGFEQFNSLLQYPMIQHKILSDLIFKKMLWHSTGVTNNFYGKVYKRDLNN